ncbi:GerW family sporulation protein [Clostridium sp. DL1XJH146]
MNDSTLNNIIKTTMENLKELIDVNTIVGEPIKENGTTIIPISRVSLGFASGGSEISSKNNSNNSLKYPFGGGSGSGVSVKPIAFLVLKGDTIKLLPMNQKNTYDKLVDQIPDLIDFFKDLNENNHEKQRKKDIED